MKVGGHLLIETPIWHGEPDKAMLFCPIGHEGPYDSDPTSCTFFNQKGLVDTMKSLGFETVSIEYLAKSTERSGVRPIKGFVRQKIKQAIKNMLLKKGFAKSNLATDRCVFQLIYRGYDQDSFDIKYWEKTHDFHTKHG